jgi:hypothetical protein
MKCPSPLLRPQHMAVERQRLHSHLSSDMRGNLRDGARLELGKERGAQDAHRTQFSDMRGNLRDGAQLERGDMKSAQSEHPGHS